ncbi:hypothetical protein [Halodesulfovibrio marinisediminis]|uniref:Uncharacterized protein n=1 Tax=Halodesulfovibrio marinisediminis DSM 17456 TaxID=1121457 RepID=A0A1N6FR19_9BACT|nr:hypothetical protein [Halodesulfovibrio marinisediminis]SIN97642.1 hypothetical protein SAMN02745161_1455 [Halodesulfovibrio marinisediminis DSM 17456]
MFHTVCSLLCSVLTLCLFLSNANCAPQQGHELPPPVTKEIAHEWPISPDWQKSTYTFHKEEFINPKIVEAMQGPFADSGSQIVSINVHNANISNQFFSQVHVRTTNTMPYVYYKEQDNEFGYTFVGATSSGINVVHTLSTHNGSGIFHTLLFFIFTDSDSMTFGLEVAPKVQPTLTLIGSLPLGDRFAGTISLENDVLTVLPPKGFAQPLPLYSGGLILRFK